MGMEKGVRKLLMTSNVSEPMIIFCFSNLGLISEGTATLLTNFPREEPKSLTDITSATHSLQE